MWDFRNRILDLEFSENAEKMAEVIKTSRQLINDGKKRQLIQRFQKSKNY